jgi:hypothetical protein
VKKPTGLVALSLRRLPSTLQYTSVSTAGRSELAPELLVGSVKTILFHQLALTRLGATKHET